MGVVSRQPLLRGQKLGYPMLIAAGPCPGSEPQRSLPVLADGLHHRIIRKRRAARNAKASVVEYAEPAMGAHPETTLTVLEQRRHQFVWQSASHCVVGKFSICETAEPRMPCPNPEGARPVLIGGVSIAVDQSLLPGVAVHQLFLQPVESCLLCADPEVSLSVLIEVPGGDGNNSVGAYELKGSLKPRTHVHRQRLVIGGADGHFLRRFGGNHVAHVVGGDPYPLSVDGFKPQCSTLIECRAPENIVTDFLG